MNCFDFPAAIANHAVDRPGHIAVICGKTRISWADFVVRAEMLAATLAKLGTRPDDVVAAIAASSVDYAVLWAAVLRLRATIAPLAPSSTPDQIAAMIADSGARLVFTDAAARSDFGSVLGQVGVVDLDDLDSFIDASAEPPPLAPLDAAAAFNIIYSSGTTGTPKGIVQSAAMRSLHITGAKALGYGPDAITLLSTPLYSNTTLVSFLPTLAWGGTAVLQAKFHSGDWLKLTWKRASCSVRQHLAQRADSLNTHSPISRIRPLASASGMNSNGLTRPRCGCCQRISASAL